MIEKAAMLLICASACSCASADRSEIGRLSVLAQWKAGAHVADVGAGNGAFALEAARIVGPTGLVYATEIGAKNVQRLQQKTKGAGNIRVVAATETSTGLPAGCCDSVYLRGVYHHLTAPAETDASLFRALRAGGSLVIIDFPPKRLLSLFFPVKGAPADRGGHGVPREVVIRELRRAGFVIVEEPSDWPGGEYCVVARKPQD
jgi:ubiquinone/menaquinone biosynthesis C-methylase UbiE